MNYKRIVRGLCLSVGLAALVGLPPRAAQADSHAPAQVKEKEKPNTKVKEKPNVKVAHHGPHTSGQKHPGGHGHPRKAPPRKPASTSGKPTTTGPSPVTETATAGKTEPATATETPTAGKTEPATATETPTAGKTETGASTGTATETPTAGKTETDAPNPDVLAAVGGVSLYGGPVAKAARVVAGQRQALFACWTSNTLPPTRPGVRVRVLAVVAADGTIAQASATAPSAVPESTLRCVESVLSKAKFEAPKLSKAALSLTVAYARKN